MSGWMLRGRLQARGIHRVSFRVVVSCCVLLRAARGGPFTPAEGAGILGKLSPLVESALWGSGVHGQRPRPVSAFFSVQLCVDRERKCDHFLLWSLCPEKPTVPGGRPVQESLLRGRLSWSTWGPLERLNEQ